jgi:hypothetical protein
VNSEQSVFAENIAAFRYAKGKPIELREERKAGESLSDLDQAISAARVRRGDEGHRILRRPKTKS